MIEKPDKKSIFQKTIAYILNLPLVKSFALARGKLIRQQSLHLFRREMFWQAASIKQFPRFCAISIGIICVYYFSRNEQSEILRMGKPIAAAFPLVDLYINAYFLLKSYKLKNRVFLRRRERNKLMRQHLAINTKTSQL